MNSLTWRQNIWMFVSQDHNSKTVFSMCLALGQALKSQLSFSRFFWMLLISCHHLTPGLILNHPVSFTPPFLVNLEWVTPISQFSVGKRPPPQPWPENSDMFSIAALMCLCLRRYGMPTTCRFMCIIWEHLKEISLHYSEIQKTDTVQMKFHMLSWWLKAQKILKTKKHWRTKRGCHGYNDDILLTSFHRCQRW